MKINYSVFTGTCLRVGLTFAFAATLSVSTQAQTAPAKQWDKTFGGNGVEFFQAAQQTTDGGYFLAGFSNSSNTGDKSEASKGSFDYWVVKLDASGNKTWDKSFGGSSADALYAAQQTTDGGYILGGATSSGATGDKSQPSRGDYDFWVVKTDATGNKLWDKTFGGDNNDRLYALQQTSDGGYILGGFSGSGTSGDKTQSLQGLLDFWIIKIDASGNKQWDKTFGGTANDVLYSVIQLSGGGYLLGGYSLSGISGDKTQPSYGNMDYWVIKLDANGNKIWDKTFGGTDLDDLKTMKQTTDGGFIIGGFSMSDISGDKTQPSQGDRDFWIVKIDANGNKVWDKTFGGPGTDILISLQQTIDNGFILAGYSDSGIGGDKSKGSQGNTDFWLVKTDATGNKLWDATFGGDNEDQLSAVSQTIDGGFVFGGYSNSGLTGDKSQASMGGNDFWFVKLAADITGVKESEAAFRLSISPNPNQGKFKLQLSNLQTSKVDVTITDLLGRVILQKQLQVTDNQLSEELEINAAKGMYVLTVQAGTGTLTRKIAVE